MTISQMIKAVDRSIDSSFADRSKPSEVRAKDRENLRAFRQILVAEKTLSTTIKMLRDFQQVVNDPEFDRIIESSLSRLIAERPNA